MVTVMLATSAMLIAYTARFQRARPQTVLWERAASHLIQILRCDRNWPAHEILYACEVTLRHRKQWRTYGLSGVSAIVTGITLWLGKDWLDARIHSFAAEHGDVVIVAVVLAYFGTFSAFHFPVWTLEGIRDALRHNLEPGARAADPPA
jgi:hypothetical protein